MMNVLVTGASGFIGSQIVTDLIKEGYAVTCCVRNVAYTKNLFPHAHVISCDFIRDTQIQDWLHRLNNIDIVINAVGIFYHPIKKVIWNTHYYTPRALFDASLKAGVKEIIHISALGIDQYEVDYATSKKAAETYLSQLAIPSIILRPSLVYGRGSYGGTSLFRGLAGLPGIMPVPGKGQQSFQPIYLPDLSQAIIKLLEHDIKEKRVLSAVSESKIKLVNILMTLRVWLGFPKAIVVHIPLFLIRLGSFFGDFIPNSGLNSTAYKMLARGNVTTDIEAKKFQEHIGFIPNNFQTGVFSQPSTVQDHWHARLYFIKPALQLSLAFVWIFSAICSVFLFPTFISYHLLAQVGIPSEWHRFVLYGASACDALIGLALLINYQIKKICVLQFLLIILYTIIITWKLPYLWLEPFGSITKNIPLLMAIYILYVLESDR